MTAQDKANILRKNWDKAHHFSDGQLNTLGWKLPLGTGMAYWEMERNVVLQADENWRNCGIGWTEEERAVLMLNGEESRWLLRNS